MDRCTGRPRQTGIDVKTLAPAGAAAVPVQQMFWLLVVASAALIWILLPFYGPIMWGIVIALLFAPVFRRLLHRLGQRPRWPRCSPC